MGDHKTCDVEGCAKNARSKSAAYCPMHYHRLYRGKALGDATELKRKSKNPHCAIEGCEKKDDGGGHCSMHATRIRRHGDPHVCIAADERDLPAGAEHHNWAGAGVGYDAAHERVRRARGAASDYDCVQCGVRAYHWSYNHDADDEVTALVRGYMIAYSPSVGSYSPRCVPCHKRFDLDRINATPAALAG